jgi:hypothetical protein
MNRESKLDDLLVNARAALAALNTDDRTARGLVDRVANLRYAEGTLIGFIDGVATFDPNVAALLAGKVETFISEAIAARILLD